MDLYLKGTLNLNSTLNAIFGNKTGDSRLGFLPNAHTEMVAFLTAFLYSDMWAEYKMEFIPFVFMLLLLLTMWSRISMDAKHSMMLYLI